MARAEKPQLSPKQLAELSALADGTLDPARARELEALVAVSPALSALYERERRVVEMLHGARATGRASARLRARIESQRPSGRSLARRRAGYAGALAGALAAAALALVLVLVLPAGAPGSPSVSQAAALAARGPARAAPPPDPSNPRSKLAQDVEEVYFPNWSRRFGWRAIGERRDRLGGRPAITVYYAWRGKRVAYTIVGAPALARPEAPVTYLHGTELRTLTLDGRVVVTWRRAGHTCVLSGSSVTANELHELAAWKSTRDRRLEPWGAPEVRESSSESSGDLGRRWRAR